MALKADFGQSHGGNPQCSDAHHCHNEATGIAFDCFYPAAEPTIKKLQESMPFPANLADALTYAVAYIDQSRQISRTMEHRYDILEKRYCAATNQISINLKEVDNLQEQTSSQHSQIIQLDDTLKAQKSITEKLQEELIKIQRGGGTRNGTEDPGTTNMMELTEIRKRLETSYSHLQEYESKYKIAHKEIADLKHELAIEKNSNTGLKEEMTSLKKDMTAQEQELTTLQKKFMEASTELVGAKHHIDVDGHIIAGLQDEKQALKKTVAKKIQEIQDVKRDCEATKKSLEAKLEKAETELKEEKKPLLPNTVTLPNPETIAGSLRGAPADVDDEFFPLELPFAITLFNHSTKNLFVTDNGMICLDESTNARDRRAGRSLPYHDQIPPYSLFPFWADLMICKDKPHGIFYEITGDAPARSITIEWYVTRYDDKTQYFQFNVLLEEARPNMVTFKYYDTAAEGNHTIGVQGPNSYKMFSHDKKGAFNGIKLVFDTTANTMQHSTFPIPQ